MTALEVATRVKQIIVQQLEVNAEAVVPTANLVQDLEADSLAIVELVMAFEEIFDIEITVDKAEKILTVQDAVDCIQRQIRLK